MTQPILTDEDVVASFQDTHSAETQRRILEDPKRYLCELGMSAENLEGVDVIVKQNTADTSYIILEEYHDNLTAEDLAGLGGGGGSASTAGSASSISSLGCGIISCLSSASSSSTAGSGGTFG